MHLGLVQRWYLIRVFSSHGIVLYIFVLVSQPGQMAPDLGEKSTPASAVFFASTIVFVSLFIRIPFASI